MSRYKAANPRKKSKRKPRYLVDSMDITAGTQETPPKTRKQLYQEYINSKEWKLKRDEFKERFGNQCAMCDSGKNLAIHHLNYDNVGNETINDVVCLCKGCHFDAHKGRLTIWKFTREEREHFNQVQHIVCDNPEMSYLFLGTYEE